MTKEILCEECKAPFPNVNEKEHHKLTEHSIYKGGEPILEGTDRAFSQAKAIMRWIFLNRKGAVGSYQIALEWYRADFLKVQEYNGQAKGFIQTRPITFEIIHQSFSPDTLVRAGQKIQEEAEMKIMAAIKAGIRPDPIDIALLPSDYTILKRRRRQGAMTAILTQG